MAQRGFTLIELLVVIGIIAVLAALIVPALFHLRTKAMETQAKQDMAEIQSAVNRYASSYSRMPLATATVKGTLPEDFTFGTDANVSGPQTAIQYSATVASSPANVRNSSELAAILMDMAALPDGTATANKDHIFNIKRSSFLSLPVVRDTRSAGVGFDGVIRDPWGSSYIISLDANGDGLTRDTFYTRGAVSEPPSSPVLNGLIKRGTDDYRFNGPCMVWSLGADKKANSGQGAKEGDNKDNILSWK